MFESNENVNNNTCVVCYKNVDIYSIGMCEHPVCYECSTRMRVLCRQNECPICRQDLPKVVFTKEIKSFRHIRKGNLLDTQYGIYFDTIEIQEKFNDLLAHTCKLCREKEIFSNFNSLKDHMRRKHELHYCDLCVENLKIFSHERRCYTRQDLAQHRRKGDVDDKSHKGHPLCEFCDQRYMDNDELYRHLRRDHLYCHFCDADGLHQYYSSYDDLRHHFRQEHYLCEEGSCAEEKFTSVFRTDIDLRAHKSSVHGKLLSKAAAKQTRTLELEFTLAPRGDYRNNRRGAAGPSTSRNSKDPRTNSCLSPNDFSLSTSSTVQQQSVDVQSTDEFPTLGNTVPVPMPNLGQAKGRGNVTIRSSIRPSTLAITDENFPALGPESMPSTSKTVNLSVSSCNKPGSNGKQYQPGSTSNVSIQVNHESNGTVTTRVSGPNIRIRPAQLSLDSDFPALGGSGHSDNSASNNNPTHWKEVVRWTCSNVSQKNVQPKPKISAPLSAPSPPPIRSGEDFPSLSKPCKSTTIVPCWVNQTTSGGSTSKTTDATKGKTKKKKAKQQNSHNNSNNESNNGLDTSNNKKSEPKMNTETKQHAKEKKKKANKNSIGEMSGGSGVNNGSPSAAIDTANSENNHELNSVQRKRTELKIDGLNTANNNALHEQNVSVINTSRGGGGEITNPPPGFKSTTAPPPGFPLKFDGTSNGLTFTNSSGQSYSILPGNNRDFVDSPHIYIPPPDFQKRNKSLVARVNEVLKEQDNIAEFRYVSGLFRQGTCTAKEYYEHCRRVMGVKAFESVFPELLVLLPDINKQQELFKVYKNEVGNTNRILELCNTCGQVLQTDCDFQHHMSSHTLENHFPALGSCTVQAKSWFRK